MSFQMNRNYIRELWNPRWFRTPYSGLFAKHIQGLSGDNGLVCQLPSTINKKMQYIFFDLSWVLPFYAKNVDWVEEKWEIDQAT
jgi:hypothetical protein